MLLTSRQDKYTNNIDKNNMNLSPRHNHHHHNDNSSIGFQMTEQLLSSAQKSYSPRKNQRSKFPPHINICPPDASQVITSHLVKDETLDNDVFQPQTMNSLPSSGTDDNHEVYSGRLYIIRQTGCTASTSSSPTRSPTKSPSRSPTTAFALRSSPPLSNQKWSPHSSPTPSPTPTPNRKTPVSVKVYKYNSDHFAVITRDVLYSGKPVFVNLRHSRVIPGECLGRFIVATNCDSGNIIEFETPELSTLGQWLDAFHVSTPPASPSRIVGGSGSGVSCHTPPTPRSPALPTLTETDEED